MKALVFFLFLACAILSANARRCEVVSVLYNDEFAIGVNTLGQSLKETNPNLSRTLLVTQEVSPLVIRDLETKGGWQIKEVERLANPHTKENGARSRLEFVFTKLAVWSLIEFDRVIYLDGDTLVTEPIDELCNCEARLCAVTRDVYFNAGVMVLTPSTELYGELLALYGDSKSYNQGEQGFLNLVFPEFQQCPYFDPRSALSPHPKTPNLFSLTSISKTVEQEKTLDRCYRLPAFYNGDFGLYVVRGDRWEVDPIFERSHPKIIHYTMGPVKPWQWLSYLMGGDAFMEWFFVYKRSLQDSELTLYYFVHLIYISTIVGTSLYGTTIFYYRCKERVSRHYSGMIYEDVVFPIAFGAFIAQTLCTVVALVGVELVSSVMLVYPLFTFIEYWVLYTTASFVSAVIFFGIHDPVDIQSFARLHAFIHTPIICLTLWLSMTYSSNAIMRFNWLTLASFAIYISSTRFIIVRIRRKYFSSHSTINNTI